MLEKFSDLEDKFVDIERKISDPEIICNRSLYQDLLKQHSELKEAVGHYQELKKIVLQIEDAASLLKDPEMVEMAKAELVVLKEKKEQLEQRLVIFLLPKDPNDRRNAFVEIRSGTGGEEAALFAADLFRMYARFAESKQWKVEVLSQNMTGIGGIKEVVFSISGANVYSQLKFESGTHRVQRVPSTEASGRIHTSAATVAILPEAEEVDIVIDSKDLRIDTYRAQGAGGQHVNKTSSAVRITHEPTGVVVACQDERSQFQNKDRAMRMLRTKLYELELQKVESQTMESRREQVGSGDRSEKIRTYNFPQGRVTDHRINLTLYCLEDILNGNKLHEFIASLQTADRINKLKMA